MQQNEFWEVVDAELKTWGEKAYSAAMFSKIYRIVGSISAGEFRSALENLSITTTRAPTLAQIRTACWPAIQKVNADRKRERLESLAPCIYCSKGGWVIAYDPADPTLEVAFICRSCNAAALLGLTESHGARVWSAEAAGGLIPRLATKESTKSYAAAMGRYMDTQRKTKAPALRDGLADAMASLGIATPQREFTDDDIPF